MDAAGTSNLPVAQKAARAVRFLGLGPRVFPDAGVAGLWRLLAVLPDLAACQVLIVVAGMEGALFPVLSGMVRQPVIAVPTSVGYGVSEGGRAALSTVLTACSPGILVVNVFGAAAKILRLHPGP